jgi:hypothetical protein
VTLSDGQDATPVVLRITPLPLLNPFCGVGGSQIRSGTDVDGDGSLDDAEVTDADVACPVAR